MKKSSSFFNLFVGGRICIIVKSYDRVRAVEYARKWALGANPEFYHFGGIGGDCTNFISQCLLAGGGVMNFASPYGWYYNSSYDRSPSWTSVAELQKFLLRMDGRGPVGKILPSISGLEIGDLIQLRQNQTHFNHTLIVSKIEGGEIYVCAHSNDALDRKLSSYQYYALMPLKITGILIK